MAGEKDGKEGNWWWCENWLTFNGDAGCCWYLSKYGPTVCPIFWPILLASGLLCFVRRWSCRVRRELKCSPHSIHSTVSWFGRFLHTVWKKRIKLVKIITKLISIVNVYINCKTLRLKGVNFKSKSLLITKQIIRNDILIIELVYTHLMYTQNLCILWYEIQFVCLWVND